ncbi:B3 domain-containing protein Os06g0194400-like [Zingiber officinale]|uniref:B3 domain-containing protein Os06g0194400-like n=1 Tax=Zingiber officinale TaxID=94328 RepID=UPI001C4C51F1|nr:B3 domain-containing protein Os06g0194400-like [Zingiber officinale]
MGAAEAASYEELRRKRLEENKKKLEQLNLPHLSLSLRNATTSPKTSPAKQIKRKISQDGTPTVLRRSLRVANLPEANYREVTADIVARPRRLFKRRDLDNRVYASDEAREYAQTKAEEVEAGLDSKFPSFVKPMLQSHTTGGFWLGLPNQFCNMYLPKKDATITLIDENGEEHDTTYLAHKKGLSAGWRGFSIYHELVDGDALVFQLVEPTTFKVYITRASEYDGS